VLHLAPDAFWAATPHEIAAAVEMVTEIRAGTGARQGKRLDEDDIAELQAMLAAAADKH
jgi:hypothetical protein